MYQAFEEEPTGSWRPAVIEKACSRSHGVSIVPEADLESMSGTAA